MHTEEARRQSNILESPSRNKLFYGVCFQNRRYGMPHTQGQKAQLQKLGVANRTKTTVDCFPLADDGADKSARASAKRM